MSDNEVRKLERLLRIRPGSGVPEYVYLGLKYEDIIQEIKRHSCTPVTPQKCIVHLDKSIQAANVKLEEGKEHIIQRGETLSGIAKRYQMKLEDLLQDNPQVKNPDEIKAGEVLEIAAPAVPTEVLWREAGKTEVEQIVYNQMPFQCGKDIHLMTPYEQPMVIKYGDFRLPLNTLGTGPYSTKSSACSDQMQLFLTEDAQAEFPFLKGCQSTAEITSSSAEEEIFVIPFDQAGVELLLELLDNSQSIEEAGKPEKDIDEASKADQNNKSELLEHLNQQLQKQHRLTPLAIFVDTVYNVTNDFFEVQLGRNIKVLKKFYISDEKLILRGYSGLRAIFKGSTYLNSAKNLIKYALQGAWRRILYSPWEKIPFVQGLKGNIITGVAVTVLDELVLKYGFGIGREGQRDLTDALVAIGTGILKVGVAAVIIAAIFASIGGTVILGFVLSAIIFGFLDWVDSSWQATEQLQDKANQLQNSDNESSDEPVRYLSGNSGLWQK